MEKTEGEKENNNTGLVVYGKGGTLPPEVLIQLIDKALTEKGIFAHIRAKLWKEIERKLNEGECMEEFVKNTMQRCGLNVLLKNAVYQEKLRLSYYDPFIFQTTFKVPDDYLEEPIDYIRTARKDLTERLVKGLNTLSRLTKIPLYSERSRSESEHLQKKWNSIGLLKCDHSQLSALYSQKDIYDTIIAISNPNAHSNRLKCTGRQVQLYLTSNTLLKLKQQYSYLHPSKYEIRPSSAEVNKVLKFGQLELAKLLCQNGSCTNEHRGILWSMTLGVETSLPQHSFHLNKLKSLVVKYHALQDDILIKDVKTVTMNDVEYFVFEDILLQVLLCFVRDSPHGTRDLFANSQRINFFPYKKMSLLVAPMCYLFQDTDKLYAVFKAIHQRYFSKLYTLSSDEKGIIGLCCLFESLMLSKTPELFHHFNVIGIPSLKVVFPWIMTAFSGILSVEQVFVLWDLIIGYDSLEILSVVTVPLVHVVVAVSILAFRSKSLFQASSAGDVEAILSDLKNISILPLIQQTLFL